VLDALRESFDVDGLELTDDVATAVEALGVGLA
jgi:hypothetical protein